jgi:hypothetical protein
MGNFEETDKHMQEAEYFMPIANDVTGAGPSHSIVFCWSP